MKTRKDGAVIWADDGLADEPEHAEATCCNCGRPGEYDDEWGEKFSSDPSDPLDGAPDYPLCPDCCDKFVPLINSPYPYYYVDAAWLLRHGDELTVGRTVPLRSGGEWTSIRDPFPQQDFIGAMEDAGFKLFYDSEDGTGPLRLDAWLNQGHEPCAYVSFSNFSECPGVYAQTLPDLMDVLSAWMPVVSHAALLEALRRLDDPKPYSEMLRYRPGSALDALASLIRKAEVGA